MTTILVTGGAGFIGSCVVRMLAGQDGINVVNVDKLTYAANLDALRAVADLPNYRFEQIDICDAAKIRAVLKQTQPDAIMHLAAESHVDRSIDGPGDFIQTNIVGTYVLLQAALEYYQDLEPARRKTFRFHHISTDEVFGSLGDSGLFTETSPYQPTSPYSASKASADHLVRAWHHTFDLPVVLSNCSNNYGPFQYPEKLIPLLILNAVDEAALPVYGRGDNVRDWLFVEDHAAALQRILETGEIGQSYNVGGNNERTNLTVVEGICDILDELRPRPGGGAHRELINFVTDRPGHDFRYAIDASKIQDELGFQPRESFETGLRKTVQWYLDNEWWWTPIRTDSDSGQRQGLKGGPGKA